MLRLNINIKNLARRLASNPKATALFLGILVAIIVGVSFIPFPSKSPNTQTEKTTEEIAENVEVLGSEEAQEASPTETLDTTVTPGSEPTLVVTPTTPTSADSEDSAQELPPPDTGNQSDSEPPLYSGPTLPPAPDKRELLVISEVLPDGWAVDKNESTSFVSGKVGQAFKVEEGGSLVLSGGEFFTASGTLSFWLKPSWDPAQGGERPLLEWGVLAEDEESFFEISAVNDMIYFSIYHDFNQYSIGDGKRIENFTDWHYIEVTWDFTQEPFERRLYVDGNLIDQGPLFGSGIQWNQPIFQVGGGHLNRKPVDFLLDELVLTNWAKSAEEITSGPP